MCKELLFWLRICVKTDDVSHLGFGTQHAYCTGASGHRCNHSAENRGWSGFSGTATESDGSRDVEVPA